MKKLLIIIYLFILNVYAFEATELLPKDFGLESESEIIEFRDALEQYAFAKGFKGFSVEEMDSFHSKVEQFIGYMRAVPGLSKYAQYFGQGYQTGLVRGSSAIAMYTGLFTAEIISSKILDQDQIITTFEQKYGQVIEAFLKKNPIPAYLFEF